MIARRCVSPSLVVVLALSMSMLGCNDKKPTADKPKPVATPSATPEAPRPPPPPILSLTPTKIHVGIDELALKSPNFKAALDQLIKKADLPKREVTVFTVDRKVPIETATKMIYVLFDAGAKAMDVKTTSRGNFPDTLRITPQKDVGKMPPCAFTGMIVDRLGVAFWPIRGGVTAKRYTKGMAGPDFSAWHEVFHKDEASCEATTLFFSAKEGLDWGHAFDLPGSVIAEKPPYKIKQFVLLREIPVPGKKVKLAPKQ